MKGIKSTPVAGPSSSAGLMRFFDVSGGGPKIPPMAVLGASIAFILLIAILNFIL